LSPDDFKDACIQVLHESAVNGLTAGESADARRLNALSLERALARMRGLFERISDRPLAWTQLGDLYARKVAALSDLESTGPRIAALQRAADVDPFDVSVHALDMQSRLALVEARDQIAKLEADGVAQGKVLNDKGRSMKLQLETGFNEAARYL